MTEHKIAGGYIRKLWPTEIEKFQGHLLRLDRTTRHARFAHGVSDTFIRDYAQRMNDMGSIVYGFFLNGEIRGAAELRKLSDHWGFDAEAAFSIERPLQDAGVGTELMGKVIRCARNRGIRHLYMSCLAENRKMQAIARKHEAELRFEYGEVIGDIIPEVPSYFSVMAEAVDDRVGMMMTVLNLEHSMKKAA